MGLRVKLILAVVAVIVGGFAIAGRLAQRQADALLLDEVRSRGHALLGAMAPPCAMAMANGEFEVVDQYLGQVSESRRARALDLEYLMILDHEGRVYAHADPPRFGEQPADEFYRRARRAEGSIHRRVPRPGGPALLEVTAPVASGVRWGTLVAGFSLAREQAMLAAARARAYAAAAALAAASALVLFLFLTRWVLRPVRELSQATRAFGDGKLERRVAVTGRDDLGRLGQAFNNMAAELQSHTEDLEGKVRERTAEIVQKNEQLGALNEALREQSAELEKLAYTDGLTGLYNHRHFREKLAAELERSRRQGHPLSLILIDVDHFKLYNDTHGHQAGDEVLRRLAELFRDNLRGVDLIARYGGEEFVALLLDTDARGALVAAEKIRKAICDHELPDDHTQPGGTLTISAGVASYPEHGSNASAIVEAADRALYQAKDAGRNQAIPAELQGEADG